MAANVYSDSSSSDESFETDVVENSGLQGYQFEPRRESLVSTNTPVESNSSDSDESTTGDRLNAIGLNWCTCRRSSTETLRRDTECICCQERPNTRTLTTPTNQDDGGACVTNNPDFTLLCLSPVVLRNVLVALNNVRADHWDVNPPDADGLRYIYAAYRQFAWWAHGRLGVGKRRVHPACVIHVIRQTFPKDGFYSGEEDSD